MAKSSDASDEHVKAAIESALAVKPSWESTPFEDRAAIFLKAADLISGKYRYELMAATMLGQGKNAWQAEIDAAAELCDFLRCVHIFSTACSQSEPTLMRCVQVQCPIRGRALRATACAQFSRRVEVMVINLTCCQFH